MLINYDDDNCSLFSLHTLMHLWHFMQYCLCHECKIFECPSSVTESHFLDSKHHKGEISDSETDEIAVYRSYAG